jgi:hypothetical protein
MSHLTVTRLKKLPWKYVDMKESYVQLGKIKMANSQNDEV